MNRRQFWCTIIAISIIEVLILFVGRDMYEDLSGLRAIGVLATIGLYYWAVVMRLDDVGVSGWYSLICCIIPPAIIVIGLLPSKNNHIIRENSNSSENTQSNNNVN